MPRKAGTRLDGVLRIEGVSLHPSASPHGREDQLVCQNDRLVENDHIEGVRMTEFQTRC